MSRKRSPIYRHISREVLAAIGRAAREIEISAGQPAQMSGEVLKSGRSDRRLARTVVALAKVAGVLAEEIMRHVPRRCARWAAAAGTCDGNVPLATLRLSAAAVSRMLEAAQEEAPVCSSDGR